MPAVRGVEKRDLPEEHIAILDVIDVSQASGDGYRNQRGSVFASPTR
jgi:hypothetical protein